MTNKEYITATLEGLGVSEADIDIIMLKADVRGDEPCEGREGAKACDLAIYSRMSAVIKGAMKNISEGGYSISWNMDAVKMFYNSLCNELGKPNVLERKPVIRCQNVW